MIGFNDSVRAALARGDGGRVRQLFEAEHDRMIAEMRAEREAVAAARRISTNPYERAMQAHLDGDPDWRSMMPLRWRVSRWWWIHQLEIFIYGGLAVGLVALWWWAL